MSALTLASRLTNRILASWPGTSGHVAAVAFVFKVSTDQWQIRNATFFYLLYLLPSQTEIGQASLALLLYLVCVFLLLRLLECDLFEVKGLDIHVCTKLFFL